MAILEFCVIGPVELRVDGQRVPLGTPKQQCLAASLVLADGCTVPLETLIDRIWGDDPPSEARANLYTYAARLRRLLRGHPCANRVSICRSTIGYALDVESDLVDLHRSRALIERARSAAQARDPHAAVSLYRSALRLWRGEPLCGLHGDWAARTRTSLHNEWLAALTEYFDLKLRLGQHAEVVGQLSAVAGEHPLDERLAELLMISLYRSRRPAAALAVFRQVSAELATQLGIDPGPRLRRLQAAVLSGLTVDGGRGEH